MPLPLAEQDIPQAENPTPCVACSGRGEFDMWPGKLCEPCSLDFMRDWPTYGEMATRLEKRAISQGRPFDRDSVDYPAAFRELSAWWLKKRKAVAA